MRIFLFITVFFVLMMPVSAGDRSGKFHTDELDIVFCLDLSGSTNGLIEDVRSQLWRIINQANLLLPAPQLRIGVVGFSRPSFKKENAYVKVLCDLTSDFDLLAYELGKIRPSIEKGDQYVGAALSTSISRISWSQSPAAVKIIYIAGNGNASPGESSYIQACNQAVEKGIIVNSLYVEGKANKISELPAWKRIATIASGYSSEITVGKRETEYDTSVNLARITEATRRVNLTYIYFGEDGAEKYRQFRAADSIAYRSGTPDFLERVYYKSRTKKQNAHWDLVDYIQAKGTLPTLTHLPDSLTEKPAVHIHRLVLALKNERNIANREIENMMRPSFFSETSQRFKKHQIADGNIFSRNVISMLIKCWERRIPDEAGQSR